MKERKLIELMAKGGIPMLIILLAVGLVTAVVEGFYNKLKLKI